MPCCVDRCCHLAGNATQTDTYDNAHQLASQTIAAPGGATEASTTYGYDSNGNVTTKTTTGTAGAAANTYTYDQANRLTSWANGSTSTTYAYDNAGNRTQAGAYTYNARDQLTTATNGTTTSTNTYDARGAQTTTATGTTTQTYTYDAFDQMTAFNGSTSYTHDALGRLTSAGTNTLTYDGTDTTPVGDGTQTFSRDPNGNLLAVSAGGSAASTFTDLHGDVTALFNPTGSSLTGSRAYDPYGNPAATAGTQVDLGYQGGWTDPATQLVGTASRWYDPTQGDFTSHDTISTITGTAAANPYAYANDNPLTGYDPSGHGILSACSEDIFATAGDAFALGELGDPAGGGVAAAIATGIGCGLIDAATAFADRNADRPAPAPRTYRQFGPYLPKYGPYLASYDPWDYYNTPSYSPNDPGPDRYVSPGHHGSNRPGKSRRSGPLLIVRSAPHVPTHDEIIAARVYQTPDNPRPSGQVTGPGIIPQNGTKTPATGASDSPITTNLVVDDNPSEQPTTYDPHAQPGNPDTWPGGLPSAQGSGEPQADDGTSSGGAETETYHRTMTDKHLAILQKTGRVPASSETFISPSREYSARYEGNLVKFSLAPGTIEALEEVGVKAPNQPYLDDIYPNMPTSFTGWNRKDVALFKSERGVVNIGLGRSGALEIFNNGISGYEVIDR
ncbi:RHS repeat-associated core domain-containing protein [Amycolatopsis sp. NPDC049253]|uniref:RHS repeat-associated core domain-containing protein n=1 Tax=Amycolatopsis sp. NPDC049253 TaxID=3155274 RepID=UPI003439E78E